MPPISAQERRRHLETLKACRAGQKREYKVSQDDIYETVSEETYKSIVQGRLAEDDFIENDDDSGYVDQGTEEWEESLPDRPRKSKTERTSRKANARQTSNSSSSTRPSSTLARNTRLGPNAQGKAMAKESASLNAYRKVKDPVASEDFMKNLMDGLGPQSLNPSGSGPSATASRHQPSSRVHSSETPSDHRKRKGTQTAFEISAGLLSSSPPKRNEIPSSSPSLGDIEDYERNETYDDCSSAGIGGFLSSEGAADVERQTKKPRINSLHHDLVDLKVEDFQMDDLLDDIKPEKPLENNEISHDIGTNISCQDASRDEKSGQDTRDKPDVPVVTPNETDIKTLAKSKAVGLDWQKVLRDLPTVSNVDSSTEANLKLLIDDSEDKPESSDAPDGNETFQKPDVGETTDFLANLPRKKKPLKTPRISKKALAQAEADRHLPKPTPVDAFVSQTDADLKIASSDDAPQGNQLKFFWLDCHEVEGALYLFGKVFDQLSSKYVACCVIVEGLERNLFVLPRPTIVDEDGIEVRPTEDDVYDEIEEVLQSHSITEFKAKVVRRKYCFEERGVPSDSDWHKVVYSYSKPAIPRNTTGRTFSKIFGTTTSAFELFLLKRKIMGPCWLDIQQAFPYEGSTPVSWCKLEVKVKNPKMINPCSDADPMAKEIPPLDILSLSVRDVMNHKDNKKEIVCVTARIWQEANLDDTIPIDQQSSVVKTFLRPLASFPAGTHEACRRSMPPIIPLKEEHMLLSVLLGTINSYDPDIIIGYDLTNVALDVILHRMRDLKTPHWSRIGRLRRDKLPSLRASGSNNHLLTGRLLCDLSSDGFKSMVVSTTWSLTELCQNYLQISREDLDPDETVDFFDSTCAKPNRLINFVKHCEADSYFQMALIHKVQYLGLTKQLTNLAGNNWNSTLYGGRAQRNEFILLHEFHRHKFICPDKLSFNDRKALAKSGGLGDGPTEPGKEKGKAVKKDKYKGGLVFEPKRGLWDKFILVMDFNSLYPSIIQEYNIDFTTIDRSSCNDDEDDRMPDLPSPDIKQGVLPKLIAGLVGRRREVKKLMKAPGVSASKAAQYDIKQLALKLTANSMYGCLGFEGSRFYARPLAALTTSKGREILTNTRELAENQNLDVIYGDTDSVMINTNALDFTTANKIGSDFKKLVNERYKLLEIDIDGVFERMLLLQKKKYAALKVNESSQARTVEIKGLDMKRREFCKLSKDTSQFILEQVLSGLPTELVVEKIHEYLSELGKEVKEGRKNLEDFIIHKKLGKNPQDYPDAKSQPHVQVALRMNLKGNVKTKAGDVIPYIFCLGEDGSSSSRSAQADKARHPDDLRRVDTPWKIDYDYYLALQVLPAIERLCEPIEGTDRSRLAECLGLDPARFKNTTASVPDTQTEFHTLESQIPESERFADASPFTVRCRHCSEQFEFRGAQADQAGMITPSGLNCPNLECRKPLGVPSLVVQMELQIRQFIGKFYEAWLICDDAACKNRTRMMSVYGRKCLNSSMGCKGQMSYEYTDKMLYNQLLYFHGLFDPSKAEAKFRGTAQADKIAQTLEANEQALAILRGVVNRYLQKNGRRFVGMDSLFSFMKIKGL